MALEIDDIRKHCNVSGSDDDVVLTRALEGAKRHVERHLGYKLDDSTMLPDGVPEDIEQAVLMIAAHWFENREAVLVGVSAQSLPIGVSEILAEHRNYSFGLSDA